MKRKRQSGALYGAGVFLAMGTAFAGGAMLKKSGTPQAKPIQPVRVAEASEGASSVHLTAPAGEASESLSTFEEVYRRVENEFTDALPSDTKLSQGAVSAMVASLEDPHSYFLNPAQRLLIDNEGKGKFAGIGAGLFLRAQKTEGYTDFKIVIVAPLPGSPAAKAGLKPGDVITRIDNKYVLGYNPLIQYIKVVEKWQAKAVTDEELEKSRQATQTKITTGIPFAAAQMALRGDATVKQLAGKTSYPVTVQRPGVANPITVTITPGTTEVSPVSTKSLSGGAVQIKVAAFTDSAPSAVKEALDKAPKGAGVVLDLRGNPGGTFPAAQKIAGMLVGAGPLVNEVRAGGKKTSIPATGTALGTRKVTVLVDKGTGSTAEAVAQGLSERGATLAGTATFGDGVAQTLYKLDDGSGFTLTTGKLMSPKGIAWTGTGLTPKVAIAPGTPEDQVLARAVATLATPVAEGK
ncbi:MAG: S41 family peptidase [Armatimonas sp.]